LQELDRAPPTTSTGACQPISPALLVQAQSNRQAANDVDRAATLTQCAARLTSAGVSVCITHFQSFPTRIQVDVSFISWTVGSLLTLGATACFTR